MTQRQFWFLALVCNIAFLFLYIFKQSALIAAQQALQKLEQREAQLQQQQKELYNNLQKLQQHASIKKRAEKDLGMRKAKLEQIIPFPNETPAIPEAQL